MSSLSEQLADLVTAHLPAEWRLISWTTEPDVLDRPLVMVDVKSIGPGPSQGVLQVEAHLYVLQPSRDSAEGNERAADAAMPFVVDVLNRVNCVTVATAERGDFLQRYPCWDITLTLYTTIEEEA